MARIEWLNPVSGNFDTATDWAGGVVPGASDVADLSGSAKSPYTVTASTNETVNSIQTAANATLAIVSGAFSAVTGTGSGANRGTITVGDARFQVGGALMNLGLIALTGSKNFRRQPSKLIVKNSATLEGGGTVSLSQNKSLGIIEADGKAAVLTNVDNTISGSGYIGTGFSISRLTLINEAAGVIDADEPTYGLLIFNDRPSTNAGLMEATNGGSLGIETTNVDNTGGMIEVTGGGTIGMSGGTITGGAIFAGTDSFVELVNGATVTGATLSIATGGEFEILNQSIATTSGIIANAGLIQLGSNGEDTHTLALDNNTTLTGGGTVSLFSEFATLEGTSAGVVLTNVDNTISGYGLLGAGKLTLVNQAAGVIEAKGTLTVDTGHNTITNAGLIETDGADYGVMVIASPVANTGTLETVGGTLTVNGSVTGPDGSAVINGGTLDFNSGFDEKVTFVGGAGVLGLAKSLNYHRAITGFSATGGTTLDLGDVGYVSPDEATFSGTATSGILTVTDGSHTALINLKGDYLGVTFTASSDNNGGTIVVASTAGGAHQFIAAAARLGGGASGSAIMLHDAPRPHPPMLTRPGTMVA